MIQLSLYKNRRLYGEGRFINYSELYRRIREGEDVHVTCQKTRRDITAQTLMRLLEKRRTLPVAVLKEIIRGEL